VVPRHLKQSALPPPPPPRVLTARAKEQLFGSSSVAGGMVMPASAAASPHRARGTQGEELEALVGLQQHSAFYAGDSAHATHALMNSGAGIARNLHGKSAANRDAAARTARPEHVSMFGTPEELAARVKYGGMSSDRWEADHVHHTRRHNLVRDQISHFNLEHDRGAQPSMRYDTEYDTELARPAANAQDAQAAPRQLDAMLRRMRGLLAGPPSRTADLVNGGARAGGPVARRTVSNVRIAQGPPDEQVHDHQRHFRRQTHSQWAISDGAPFEASVVDLSRLQKTLKGTAWAAKPAEASEFSPKFQQMLVARARRATLRVSAGMAQRELARQRLALNSERTKPYEHILADSWEESHVHHARRHALQKNLANSWEISQGGGAGGAQGGGSEAAQGAMRRTGRKMWAPKTATGSIIA